MYTLLVRLMFVAALLQLGHSVSDFVNCQDRHCAGWIDRASQEILKIDWKPMSVFPEEGKRFR
jgi:hypothetical protein